MEPLEQRTLLSVDTSWVPAVDSAWFAEVAPAAAPAEAYAALSAAGKSNSETVLWKGEPLQAMPGQWLVQLTQEGAALAGSPAGAWPLLESSGFSGRVLSGLGMEGGLLVETEAGVSVEDVSAWLHGNPYVQSFEPNGVITAAAIPDDPSFDQLWGLHNTGQFVGTQTGTVDADIDAPEAWDITTGDATIVVGVIDTGVDYNHPDLAANMWTNPGEIPGNGLDDDANGFVDDVHGYDFYDGDGDPMDETGHGTHCSGTIAGVGDNGVGVAGVNWHASIMAIRFLGPGGGETAAAVKSVNYATMMNRRGVNIRLTSNSWGGGGFDATLQSVIAASEQAGMLFVAAAGNDGVDTDASPNYPSCYNVPNVIAVAATDSRDELASFSNYGRTTVDLAAPGVDIYSTLPGNTYDYYSGTSMATPHVAGVAALAWAAKPSATYQEIRDALFAGVDPIVGLTGKMVTGGRLNALKTVQQMVFIVTSSNPAAGSKLSVPPTDVTLSLNHDVDAFTLQASDFTVNDLPANRVTMADARTLTFHFDASPVTGEGPQVMQVQAGAFLRAGDAFPVRPWQGTFYYDLVPMQVVSTSPDEGAVVPAAPVQIVLNFNEPIRAASVDTGDLVLNFGRVTVATAVDADTVAYTVLELPPEGPVTYRILDGELLDVHGTPFGGYEGHFYIDDPLLELYQPDLAPKWMIVDQSVTRSMLWIGDSFDIADLDVTLEITHSRDRDLALDLIAPDGTQVDLFTHVGGAGGGFRGTILDDEAARPITAGTAPFRGRFRPQQPLSALDGGNVYGWWTLELHDDGASEIGSLDSWSMVILRGDNPPPQLEFVSPLPADGGHLRMDLGQLDVRFGEEMDPATVNDPANWRLVEAGADGTFDTADDVQFALSFAAPYESGQDLTLRIDNAPLPLGRYRFTAASGGLTDRTGVALDGDGDGAEGGDFVRRFDMLPRLDVFPYVEGFEEGSLAALGAYWEFPTTLGGQVLVTPDSGPRDAYHLKLTQVYEGGASAVLHMDLLDGDTQAQNVKLDFWQKAEGYPDAHEGWVQMRPNDASGWVNVLQLDEPVEYTHYFIDLDPLARDAGLSYTDDFQVRFYHYGYPGLGDAQAYYIDDLRVNWDARGPQVVAHDMETAPGFPITATGIAFTFNEDVQADSFTLADVVEFTGPGGVSLMNQLLSVSGAGNQYTVHFRAKTAPGDYTMLIGPQIVDLSGNPMDQNGTSPNGEVPADRYTATVTIATMPHIIGQVPSPDMYGPIHAVRLYFDKDMDPESFSIAADILSVTGPEGTVEADDYRWIDARTLELEFPMQRAAGTYQVTVEPRIRDAAGFELDQDRDLVPGEQPDDRYLFQFTLHSPQGPDPHALYPDELLAVADAPRELAVGDVNGDGAPDFVTANQWDQSVSVVLGDGRGASVHTASYAVGLQPVAVALADLDGDGWLDIVTANKANDNLSVLINLGDGTFASQRTVAAGVDPWAVAAGDLDGDGIPDLVVVNNFIATLSVLAGLGGGTFAAPVAYAVGTGPAHAVLADFNGDGALDAAVANRGSNNVSVLLGRGDRTFQAQTTYAVGHDPWFLAVGDADGDTRADLVAVNHQDNTVTVLEGNGSGGFATSGSPRVGLAPRAVALGDLNGDGRADLVTVNGAGDDVSVLLGQPGGTFAPPVAYDAGGGPWSLALLDFNGDGALDVLAANGGGDDVSVLLGLGDGTFPNQILSTAGDYPNAVALADLNADGLLDAVSTNYNSDDISVRLGLAGGRFAPQTRYDVGDGPQGAAVGDLNGDGRPDVVAANSLSGSVAVLYGTGGGALAAPFFLDAGLGPRSVAMADLNGDSLMDLVAANAQGNTVSVFVNIGGGNFAGRSTYAAGLFPVSVTVADVNGDLIPDILTANTNGNNVSVLLGTGTGAFLIPRNYPAGTKPSSLAVGDLNGDGRADVVVANPLERAVSVLMGQPGGTLGTRTATGVPYGATAVALGDANGDARLDLAVTGNHQVTLLAGNGDGTFPRQAVYDVGANPLALAAADLNGDRQLDLVTANADDDNLSTLLSTLRGLWHSPSGSVTGPVDAIRFHFPGAMDTTSFSPAADVASFVGPGGAIAVSGFAWLDNTTLEVRFAPQQDPGPYRMSIGPNILDAAGRPMNLDRDSQAGETPDDVYQAAFVLGVQAEDLGTVDFLERAGLNPSSGDRWYSLRTAHAGFLTAEALFSAIGGSAHLALYDAAYALVAQSAAAPGGERLDVATAAGLTYLLRLSGTNADVDLRLTNLVDRQQSSVDVLGTGAGDQFQLALGAAIQVTINGTAYQFDPLVITTVDFDGGAGDDAATLIGSADAETALMRPQQAIATLTRGAMTARVSNAETVVFQGGPNDTAFLYDTPGAETFTASPTEAVMAGAAFTLRAVGVGTVHGYGVSGGHDVAQFYDSTGDDSFVGKPDYSKLTGAGYFVRAKTFDEVIAHSDPGDNDQAQLTDSAGRDALTATPAAATLSGPGYSVTAAGYENVFAYARTGGFDTALLAGSAAADRLVATNEYAKLFGPGFFVRAKFFEEVTATGGGGIDRADLSDSPGNDVLDAGPGSAVLYLDRSDPANAALRSYKNTALGFTTVVAKFAQGGANDVAYLRDSSGDELFTALWNKAVMANTAAGWSISASAFDQVYGYASSGNDVAHLYAKLSGGALAAQPAWTSLSGAGYLLRAESFDEVYAHGSAGANDTGTLFDSAGNDFLEAKDNWARFSIASPATVYWVYDFDHVEAQSSNAGDTKNVDPNTADWLFLVGWL